MADAEVLTEVPEALKRLIRYIVRAFYSIEHALIIDMLVHHPCIKEDDLIELLKMDRKQMRQYINTLKNDKFVKVRMRVETDMEGRTTRHNYYFINYTVFVNVVKYKLDHMRRKIETEERDSTSRASFKCPSCGSVFTDLEADQLFDPYTGSFRCTYCQNEVEEEMSATPKKDARTLMVKFNEQIEPIFALLREVEDVKLSEELNNPEPTDLSSITKKEKASSSSTQLTDRWSNKVGPGIKYDETVTINMSETAEQNKPAAPAKAQPVWMSQSTIDTAPTDTYDKPSDSYAEPGASDSANLVNNDDIMRTLLAHEKKASAPNLPHAVAPGLSGPAAGSDEDTTSSESEDEMPQATITPAPRLNTAVPPSSNVDVMESDEDDEETDPMVTIGNQKVSYHDVTDDLVAKMTQSEKEAYIRVGQEMYQNMFE